MAQAAGVTIRGIVQRLLPSRWTDDRDLDRPVRFGPYGDVRMEQMFAKNHLLADEGSYFAANNGQAGLATAAAPVAFSATNPFLTIYNSDTPGPNAKSIFLDFLRLVCTAPGTAGALTQCAVTIDIGNRFTSGGSVLTPFCPNMGLANNKSVAVVNAGNLVASAATGSVRTPLGIATLKGVTPPVIGDMAMVNFAGDSGGMTIATATVTLAIVNAVPVIIGPGQTALFHLWLVSQSAASSFVPELGWWER